MGSGRKAKNSALRTYHLWQKYLRELSASNASERDSPASYIVMVATAELFSVLPWSFSSLQKCPKFYFYFFD